MIQVNESAATVGDRIQDVRSKVGMSQRELARQSGISQPTVNRIERGDREPSMTEIALLADACGVLVADLHGRNTIVDEVRCAGRTDDGMARVLSDYLVYAFSCAKRLDEMHVPDPA